MRQDVKCSIYTYCSIFIVWGFISLTSISLAQGNTWTIKADMPTARLGFSTAVVDGKIYAVGGYQEANYPGLTSLQEYDPATDTWTIRDNMPTGRRWLTACAIEGIIYAIGGFYNEGSPPLTTVEAYDVANDTWTTKAPMLIACKGLAAAVVDGKIYVMGGANINDELIASVEMYDPVTDTWTQRTDMPTARAMFSASVVDGKIYAVGGPGPGLPGITTVEEYDPASDTWTTKLDMPTARWGLSTTNVDTKIYAIGGHSGSSSLDVVEVYDPSNNSWTNVSDMPTARFGLSISAVNGKIYAIGGSTISFPPHPGLQTVEEYTPFIMTGIEHTFGEVNNPSDIILYQNYPNPFNPSTIVSYSIPKSQNVQLNVFDILGNKVSSLVNGFKSSGLHSVTFDASILSSGIYTYRLRTGSLVLVKKLIVIK